jgi:hypothetical protein
VVVLEGARAKIGVRGGVRCSEGSAVANVRAEALALLSPDLKPVGRPKKDEGG